MSNIDDMFLNYKDYQNSSNEYVLGSDGYKLEQNAKRTFFENVGYYGGDIKIGAQRGVAKLGEGILSLLAAGAEKFVLGPESMKLLDPEGDGLVKDIGEFFKNEVYPRIGETETLAGGITEGITQFITPGVGYYKLFNGLIKAKGVWPFISRALLAETATVGTAQVPGDPNFVGFISQLLGVDTTKADSIAKEVFNYLATPADVSQGYDADKVFEEKFKAIISDAPLGPVGEGLVPLFGMAIKGMKKLFKGKPDVIKDLSGKINSSAGAKMNPDGPLAKEMQIKQEATSSLYNTITNNPEGFSITIAGKTPQDLGYQGGYMVAPLKQTELVFTDKTFTIEQAKKLIDNVEALEQALGGKYAEVYAGGWLEDGKYYLDASIRIDNLDDALYIARSGKQLGIFDLNEFKTIKTTEGINQLKESGSYSIGKQIDQRGETQSIGQGFEKARMEIEGGTE